MRAAVVNPSAVKSGSATVLTCATEMLTVAGAIGVTVDEPAPDVVTGAGSAIAVETHPPALSLTGCDRSHDVPVP